jgi:hypothetical protein
MEKRISDHYLGRAPEACRLKPELAQFVGFKLKVSVMIEIDRSLPLL